MAGITDLFGQATEALPGGPMVLLAGALIAAPVARRVGRPALKAVVRVTLATSDRVRSATASTRGAIGGLTDEVRRERAEPSEMAPDPVA